MRLLLLRRGFLLLVTACVACTDRRVDTAVKMQDVPPAPAVAAPAPPVTVVDGGVPDLATEATLALAIPARGQAPESPPSGWCGETAIQEGLLYLGMWAPQRLINKAGRPAHPDLYATEIPAALDDLGVRYSFYSQGRGYDGFARWTEKALREGDPVLAGVKILPTAHPDWGLDHFVLVVGYGTKGMLANTTWGYRVWASDKTTTGISLKGAFYGIRLQGLRTTPREALASGSVAAPARVSLIEEGLTKVKLHTACIDTKAGQGYRIEQRTKATDDKPIWTSETLIADPTTNANASSMQLGKDVLVDADSPARFQCVPVGL